MASKNMAYDHATYITRQGAAMGEAGGGATTAYGKFNAFTAAQAFSAQMTVTTAGTAAGHGFRIGQVSGTATTFLGTATLGTNTAGYTTNLALTTSAGGGSLAAGDQLVAYSLADATGKAAIAFEYAVQPLANVTA